MIGIIAAAGLSVFVAQASNPSAQVDCRFAGSFEKFMACEKAQQRPVAKDNAIKSTVGSWAVSHVADAMEDRWRMTANAPSTSGRSSISITCDSSTGLSATFYPKSYLKGTGPGEVIVKLDEARPIKLSVVGFGRYGDVIALLQAEPLLPGLIDAHQVTVRFDSGNSESDEVYQFTDLSAGKLMLERACPLH